MKHKGVSHDDLHRQWGESEREREGGRGWERDSFRISKCLLGSACAFSLGGREGKKGKQEGVDNVRMEKKMRGQERGS